MSDCSHPVWVLRRQRTICATCGIQKESIPTPEQVARYERNPNGEPLVIGIYPFGKTDVET